MRLYFCELRSKARDWLWRDAKPSPRLTASLNRACRRRSCLTPTLRRRSGRRRGSNSTSPANSSRTAATTAATRNSPSSTPSSLAAAASPISRRASESRHGRGLHGRRRSGQGHAHGAAGRGLRRGHPQHHRTLRQWELSLRIDLTRSPSLERPLFALRDGWCRRILLKNSNFCVDHNSEDRWQPRWKIP